MILLIRKRFLVMEALQSNFEMPLMLSYIYVFDDGVHFIRYGNLIVWKTGMNFLNQSNNEVKPNILSCINVVWCKLLCNIFTALKLNQWTLLFWRQVVVSNEVYFEKFLAIFAVL